MNHSLHNSKTIYSPQHVSSWLLLAASAGTVNGIGFLMCEQLVSHITGTVTRLGLGWEQLGEFAECLAVVLSFVAGAATSIVSIQGRARRGQKPQWATPLIYVALILTGVAVGGHTGFFGKFGASIHPDFRTVAPVALLAFTMGLQNATVATTTGQAIRTTHLTGPATDMGVHLGVALLSTGADRRDALLGSALRGGKVAAFLSGVALAVYLAGNFGFLSLLVPATFVLTAAGISFTTAWIPQASVQLATTHQNRNLLVSQEFSNSSADRWSS